MTDRDIGEQVTIFVYHAATMEQAAGEAAMHIGRTLSTPPLLLPSTLEKQDALVEAVVRSFHELSLSPSVALPEPWFSPAAGSLFGRRPAWRDAVLALPDKQDRQVRLPGHLLDADTLVYVVHVNAVARTGPFLLDLVSRYVHRRDRVRHLVDPDRAGHAAEDNLALRPTWCVVGCDVPPGIVAVTHDLIAGELFALCLAERFFDRPAEFASPWEDRVVQRATELELGVRFPGEIRIQIVGDTGDARALDATRAVVDLLRQRMGILSHD